MCARVQRGFQIYIIIGGKDYFRPKSIHHHCVFYIFAALSREWICWAITKTFLQKSNLIDLKHISEKRKNQYIIVTNLLPPFSVKNEVKTGTIKALKQCENSTIPSDKHKRKRKRKLDNQQILTSLRARQAKVQKTFKNLHM